ncbi:MAG: uncharacterized protein K0S27_1501 [Gammaproteobacteria bacterium]|jgi:uncharacterized protein (DUF1810 family)|nr:uncharacterized protein [Gammaproteobacteria bacterium]
MQQELQRFRVVQERGLKGGDTYNAALQQIKAGRKTGHWIWYVLPQFRSLVPYQEHALSTQYGIADFDEACEYLQDPLLFERYYTMVKEIKKQLMEEKVPVAELIPAAIDVKKLASSLTLFRQAAQHLKEKPEADPRLAELWQCCNDIFIDETLGIHPCEETVKHLSGSQVFSGEELASQLGAYQKSRSTGWQFYYNFLGLVSLYYFMENYFLGTEKWHIKSRDVKMSAAVKLQAIIHPNYKNKIIFTPHETQALQEGHLGEIVAAHGGLEKILQEADQRLEKLLQEAHKQPHEEHKNDREGGTSPRLSFPSR